MNPVGLILNVFLCCIVNMHVLYKYEINLIATEKCYCDVTVFFCGPQGWQQRNVIVMLQCISVDHKGGCNVYREGLGTRRVAVISIGRVLGLPG